MPPEEPMKPEPPILTAIPEAPKEVELTIPSSVISPFRDAHLPAAFRGGGSLTDEDFNLLFRSVGSFYHLCPLSNPQTNIVTGLLFGGRSQTG